MVYDIQVCGRLVKSIRMELKPVPSWSSSQAVTKPVCTVKNSWWWTEELSETCRPSFQNKFEKLVHLSFIFEPCIDKNIINSNQHVHIFIKNTLKSCKIHFTPTCFGSYKIQPQGAIIRSWLKYLQVHGASPYSRYCGCIGEPVCVLSAVWKRTVAA